MEHSQDDDIEPNFETGTAYSLRRRRTNVGPWRDKKEFLQVYDWIYGPTSNLETKQQAYRQMKVWKLRRINLTPGTVLSTLIVLEAQLKDHNFTEAKREEDVTLVYSSALTRFLNYMSAISQNENMMTMYAAARELNLDSFLVDLRHLCAHGHTIPRLEVFRSTSAYCLQWLREFYWDNEKETMVDVDARNVRKKDVTNFDEAVRKMLQIYDAIAEVIGKKCSVVADVKRCLSGDRMILFKRFYMKGEEKDFNNLLGLALVSISRSVKRGKAVKDLSQIFLDAMMQMTYFFESGHDASKAGDPIDLVAMHQGLFKMIASHGFIEDLFYTLIEMAENDLETVTRRKGAGFWANQIAIGFLAFKRVKMAHKRKLEENETTRPSLSSINLKTIANNILEIYKDLGYNVREILIFGDSTKCPWTLSFSREYLMERIERISEYTVDVVQNALEFIEPALTLEEIGRLQNIIDIYTNSQRNENVPTTGRIYTLRDVSRKGTNEPEMMETDEKPTKFGIWTKVSGGEWHNCPLGRLPWQ